MPDSCSCPPEAGRSVCEVRQPTATPPMNGAVCATCQQAGKRVEGQTVKALLAVSLRTVHAVEYCFCRTATCPVVYFAVDGSHTVTRDHVRERVYQA